MKVKFRVLEHNKPGFIGVILVIHEVEGEAVEAYIRVQNTIHGEWKWEHGHKRPVSLERECERFDQWTVDNFSDDPRVQG